MIAEIRDIIKSSAARKSFFTVSEALISPLFVIVLLPVFLNILGAEQYGIYVLASSFSGIVGLLNIGGATTLTKFISKYRGEKRLNKIRSLTSTIFSFQFLISILFIGVSFLFISLIADNVYSDNRDVILIKKILWFAIPVFVIDLFETNYNGLHKGYERFGVATTTFFISKLMRFGVQIIAILWTRDIVELYKFMLLNSIVVFILHTCLCKIIYREVTFFIESKLSTLKELFSFSMWTWALSIISTITLQADKWIIVGLLDLRILGYYGIASSIFNQLNALLSSSISWIFPKISASGITRRFKNLYTKLNFLILMISILGSIFTIIVSDFVFVRWLGEDYWSIKPYLWMFLSILPIASLTILPHYTSFGFGKAKRVFLLYILEIGIRLLGFIVLLLNFDLTTAIASFAMSYAVVGIFYNHYISIDLGLSAKAKIRIYQSTILSFILFVPIFLMWGNILT